jgi:hypothetical protein
MADPPGVIGAADENIFHKGARVVSSGFVKRGWPIVAGHIWWLIHICAACEFHLNRMNPVGRIAIMTRRPAATKTSIRDMAELRSAATRLYITDKVFACRAAIIGSYV